MWYLLVMPIPNALTRMIHKNGKVVKFEISRIQNAITNSIIDVENTKAWEANDRSIKYAELVRQRIYSNFYDAKHLTEFFARVLLSFDPGEREERLRRVEFAPRLTTLFLLHFLHTKGTQELEAGDDKKLTEFVKGLFAPHIKGPAMLSMIASVFAEKAEIKFKSGLTTGDQFPDRDFIQDQIEITLKEIGEVMLAEGFMIFREGKMKVSQGEITEAQFTNNGIHKDRVRKTLTWNIQNECDTVFGMNDWVTGRGGKSFKELMEMSDNRFYNDISGVVKKITNRGDEVKVVIIAGPSCSNKTTTTTIIEQELAKEGLKLKQLNIDDYFYNLSEHPKDEFGDYDYEMPGAIDIPTLNNNLRDLIQGKTTKIPRYDFKTGCRNGYSDFSVAQDEIILIDCLHGLFQKLTAAVPPSKKFKIYTESANMLRSSDSAYTMWTDVRLMKRMIRDSRYRNYEVKKSLEHWAYVRKGELKHIIPYIYSVDAVLNSGLPYELPILKKVLMDQMPDREYLKDLRYQNRLDPYIRWVRVLTLLDTVLEYDNIDDVSPYSPIREFIGGSAYTIAHND